MGRAAGESARLDKIVYLPCAHSPLKSAQPHASTDERMRWLKKSLAREKWAEISSFEIKRAGVSYSVETAAYWRQKHPQASLFWIMGSDQWQTLPQWKDFRQLAQWVHFLVFPRPKEPKSRRGVGMTLLPFRFDFSSTEIRQRVQKGHSVRGLVSEKIEASVQESRFYQ